MNHDTKITYSELKVKLKIINLKMNYGSGNNFIIENFEYTTEID
jgi:hypothetical protein